MIHLFNQIILGDTLSKCFREAAIISFCAVLPALVVSSRTDQRPHKRAVILASDTNFLWIDARSEKEFNRAHVPGALCLNEQNWEAGLRQVYESWHPPQQIVVYCSAGCSASEKIAGKLSKLGVEPVEVFEGGFERWKEMKK